METELKAQDMIKYLASALFIKSVEAKDFDLPAAKKCIQDAFETATTMLYALELDNDLKKCQYDAIQNELEITYNRIFNNDTTNVTNITRRN